VRFSKIRGLKCKAGKKPRELFTLV
jgi:hypothetical protein